MLPILYVPWRQVEMLLLGLALRVFNPVSIRANFAAVLGFIRKPPNSYYPRTNQRASIDVVGKSTITCMVCLPKLPTM